MPRQHSKFARTFFISAALCAALGVLPARAQNFQDDPVHARLSQLPFLRLLTNSAIANDGVTRDKADAS